MEFIIGKIYITKKDIVYATVDSDCKPEYLEGQDTEFNTTEFSSELFEYLSKDPKNIGKEYLLEERGEKYKVIDITLPKGTVLEKIKSRIYDDEQGWHRFKIQGTNVEVFLVKYKSEVWQKDQITESGLVEIS